jgi:exopolysaccharide production protein ExoY
MTALRNEVAGPSGAGAQSAEIVRLPLVATGFYSQRGKRILDILLATPLLFLSLPLLAVAGVAALVCQGRPIFYASVRVGQHGRSFRMWKLRTMVRDADDCLDRWRSAGDERAMVYLHAFKLQEDPRVTPLGRWLRRTSIDELPQLFNVIRGEMSLVGPRPVVAEELQHYGRNVELFLSCRPGVTGLWQVNGRNDIDYPERVAVELDCCTTISLRRDLRILVETIGAPFRMDGR